MRRPSRGAVNSAATPRGGERSRYSEAGDTLIEVLLALIVLSLASVAVIAAFSTTISASSEHRSLATFNTMIRSATEQAISQVQGTSAVPFNNCAPLAYYQAGIGTVNFAPPPSGTDYTAAITGVSYWNGPAGFVSGNAAYLLCLSTYPNSPQEITLTITDPDNNTSYSNSFVVDDSVAVPPVPVCSSGAVADLLVFNTEPAGANAGSAFTVQPEIWVKNTAGNCVVTSDLSPVTMTITAGTGTSGAVLSNCSVPPGSGDLNYQNCSINLAGNTAYTLTATDNNGTLTATSSPFYVIAQLAVPVITAATPSNTAPNALTVVFTPPGNAQVGQSYSAEACTNSAMTNGCVNQGSITSGSDMTGLVSGTAYYLQVTALAGNGFIASTSAVYGPSSATISQLGAPGTPALNYGPVAGSITVTFSGSTPLIGGQTYSAKACTNGGMTTGCVTTGSITSGGTFTGLVYSMGNAGTAYFVTVTANANNGFTASAASGVSTSHADTSQVNAPTGVTAVAGGSTNSLKVTFTASGGSGVANYSATYCTNSGMTTGCHTQNNVTSPTTITNLTHHGSYWVQITANPNAGYVSNISTPSVNGTAS